MKQFTTRHKHSFSQTQKKAVKQLEDPLCQSDYKTQMIYKGVRDILSLSLIFFLLRESRNRVLGLCAYLVEPYCMDFLLVMVNYA
jgi:hypothetical protein